MCGIVGFIDKSKSINIVNDMLEIQSYRGPDDSGVYFDEKSGVHFGHNRLSIQDLSSHGHQPFVSDCGNYIIVFNGEVYNFKAIRTELQNLGYNFISNSDTEVILYSYKQWGIKCIDKFIGMFAFAILDKVEDKLVLVRDRAGVKPLYYYADEKEFMFSSEIKSFHKHPKFKKEQNLEVLPYFFQFGYIPAPFTIFQNCFKLEAGHYLELKIDNLEFKIIKYWDVTDFYLQEKFTKNEDEIIEDIEKILDDAIDLRMVSDVPVGVFLSGGYDSSLVASILAKKQGKKINTFTIGFDDEKYNEAEHAKTIAEYLGTNHTEYYMKNSDMLDLVEKLPFYYDEPFGDSSALPTMIVSKLAKVYIYDNSKVGMEFDDENIYYFHDETNGGLARAINHVVDVALVDGKELAVYFDQDSSIDISLIQKLFESYDNLKEKYTELFVVGTQPTMPDGGNYPIKLGDNFYKNYYKASEIITSGMTFRLQDIGYFDEDLFLDMVDFDICWRAVENDKLVVVDRDIKMSHEVGVNTIKIPFKILPISSPIRNYYQMRNVLYCALYKNKKSKFTVTYYMLRRFVNVLINLIFADKKLLRLQYNIKGIKDAINKNMGKIKI